MDNELVCPGCGHVFIVHDDYESGDCPGCNEHHYYWDHVYDEESGEEFFGGYYWD